MVKCVLTFRTKCFRVLSVIFWSSIFLEFTVTCGSMFVLAFLQNFWSRCNCFPSHLWVKVFVSINKVVRIVITQQFHWVVQGLGRDKTHLQYEKEDPAYT